MKTLDSLLTEVRRCRVCADVLPLGPRPVVQMSSTARILIASQAPGTKVHETGIPFFDASGARLREWMGLSEDEFYDESRVAIVPMGMCYPGVRKAAVTRLHVLNVHRCGVSDCWRTCPT